MLHYWIPLYPCKCRNVDEYERLVRANCNKLILKPITSMRSETKDTVRTPNSLWRSVTKYPFGLPPSNSSKSFENNDLYVYQQLNKTHQIDYHISLFLFVAYRLCSKHLRSFFSNGLRFPNQLQECRVCMNVDLLILYMYVNRALLNTPQSSLNKVQVTMSARPALTVTKQE